MHILLIEDNLKTAQFIEQGLTAHYFTVATANDGQEGLFLAKNHDFDLIISDVMLPYMDGWDVVSRVRDFNADIPILFLTACDEVADKVKGLELGADDYLVKPFSFSELLVRVRTLLRRTQPRQSHLLQIADLKIDATKHQATRGSQTLKLTVKEFKLLQLFASRLGEVLSRTYIAEQVWDINFDSDTNVIDVAIKRLRDKLDRDFQQKLLHTVHGIGYVMEVRE